MASAPLRGRISAPTGSGTIQTGDISRIAEGVPWRAEHFALHAVRHPL